MLPVSDAYIKSWPIGYGPTNRYGNRGVHFTKLLESRRQKKPFDLVLPWMMQYGEILSGHNEYENVESTNPINMDNIYVVDRKRLYNAAYKKWIGKVKSSQSQLLSAFAERQKTFDSISERAVKLYTGLIAAKRGDVRTLKRIWGKGAGIRQNLRTNGSHVLEYSFGYAPLIGDIKSSIETLCNGVPPVMITAKADQKFSTSVPLGAHEDGFHNRSYELSWRLGGKVSISNPNLALANQLGLINPVSTLWEITPWSFVFDYFVNVSDFIASFTDLVGFEVSQSYNTVALSEDVHILIVPRGAPEYSSGKTEKSMHIKREPGIPMPTLALRPPWGFSVGRASTSVALLLQQLKGK